MVRFYSTHTHFGLSMTDSWPGPSHTMTMRGEQLVEGKLHRDTVDSSSRHSRSRFRRVVVSGAILAVGCAAVMTAASEGSAADKPTLTIGIASACGNLNPVGGNLFELSGAYEPLMVARTESNLQPGLATSWKVSGGNKVITLTLRPNAGFSDGTPLTAQAVKDWLAYRVLKQSQYNSRFVPLRSVDVLSKYVVRVTVESPDPVLANAFARDYGTIASPKAVAASESDPQHDYLATHTDGAGPYTLLASQSVIGDHCTYVPNKYYYDKSKIHWGKVVIKAIADPNAQLDAIKTGQIDVMVTGDPSVASAAASAGIKVLAESGLINELVFLDRNGTIVKALGDPRVRQALNYAVDRNKIAAGLSVGEPGVPTDNPNNEQAVDPKYNKYYTYNPAKARSLLAAAGYPNGFSFTAYALGPWAGYRNLGPFCGAIAQDLAAVGVNMQLTVTSSSTANAQALTSHTYAAECITVVAGNPWRFYAAWLRPHAFLGDQHGWHDPVISKLWLQAQRLNAKAADPLWRKAEARMITQADFLPVYQPKQFTFVNKRVGGIAPNTSGDPDPPTNRFADWYPTGK